MKRCIANIMLLMGVTGLITSAHSADNPLRPFVWDYRLIVVNQPTQLGAVLARFSAYQSAIDERDIAWFVLSNKQVHTNLKKPVFAGFNESVNAYLQLRKGETVLVGKDGGVKARQATMNLDLLLSHIDRMPMRRAEMQSSQLW